MLCAGILTMVIIKYAYSVQCIQRSCCRTTITADKHRHGYAYVETRILLSSKWFISLQYMTEIANYLKHP